jgi:Domain of unknown function (DUF5667)
MDSVALAQLAWRLQRLHSVSAPERLRRTGLARVLAMSPVRPYAHVVPLAPRRQRQLLLTSRRLAATAAAVFLLAYGTFVVSAASLPDSPLYPVKLLVEDARVAVAPAEERPLIYVEQATRRIEETDALISDGRISAAERSASDAAKRIESAQVAAAQQSPAPQVRAAIGSTVAQYRSVSESLASRGGSSPPVTSGQPVVAARPPAAIAPVEEPGSAAVETDGGDTRGDPTSIPVQAVNAPGGTTAFAAIPTLRPADGRPAATPDANARVSAPASNSFVGIDSGPSGRVTAPSSSDVAPIDGERVTPRPTGSPTVPQTATATPRASATPTVTPRPNVSATATPRAGVTSGATVVPSATAGSAAPQVGFTPIPGDVLEPGAGGQVPAPSRLGASGGSGG